MSPPGSYPRCVGDLRPQPGDPEKLIYFMEVVASRDEHFLRAVLRQ